MTHPLTDDHISAIFDHDVDLEDQMRLAYDKGRNEQLEQVLKWLKDCIHYDFFYIENRALMNVKIRRELKKAMRFPQKNTNVKN
jgi:hypothetical protein